MAKFAWNNAKNASFSHKLFKLNCKYYSQMSYKEDINPRSKLKSADKLLIELRKSIIACKENLYHAQKLQKRANDKGVKLKSYAPSGKV